MGPGARQRRAPLLHARAARRLARGLVRRTAIAVFALAAALAIGAPPPPAGAAAAPIFKLTDPRGDDHGDGSLIYPDRDDLKPGDLDLISFSARPEGDGTLFEATFARPIRKPARHPVDEGGTSLDWIARFGFYTFNLDVYIDMDRVPGSGETAMLPGRRAEVDSAFAWERAICLTPNPYEAEETLKRFWFNAARERAKQTTPHLDDATEDSLRQAVAADVKKRILFPTRVRVSGSTVQFLVPGSFLDGPARAGWGYVAVVSGADIVQRLDLGTTVGLKKKPVPSLMLLPVKTGRSREAFGGGRSDDALEPPLIDILVPPGAKQETLLRDYDLRTGRPVRLPGVVPARAER